MGAHTHARSGLSGGSRNSFPLRGVRSESWQISSFPLELRGQAARLAGRGAARRAQHGPLPRRERERRPVSPLAVHPASYAAPHPMHHAARLGEFPRWHGTGRCQWGDWLSAIQDWLTDDSRVNQHIVCRSLFRPAISGTLPIWTYNI